jgi:hypothetical protein
MMAALIQWEAVVAGAMVENFHHASSLWTICVRYIDPQISIMRRDGAYY